jgi:hypothetical protein
MKDSLKKVLEKIDPKVFTEEVQGELVTLIESKVKVAQEAGFEAGYNKGLEEVKKLDEDHAAKLDSALTLVTEQAEKKLQKLDEEHAAKLEEAVKIIDEDHAKKLEEIVEAVDADHSSKLQQLVEKIDADHSGKLQKIVEFYEKKCNTKLVEKIDKYLSAVLEEVLPTDKTVDYVKMHRLEEAQRKLKEILVVNEDYVQAEIREALEDARQQMDSKEKQLNQIMAEKVDLKNVIKKNEATQLLEKVTKDMPATKKAFIEKYFDGADSKLISEKLDEAVKAFDTTQNETRNKAILEKKNTGTKVTIPKTEDPIVESVSSDAQTVPSNNGNDQQVMQSYADRVSRSLQARK